MAKIDVMQLKKTREIQEAEDDDLIVDISKSKKLHKKPVEKEEYTETEEERRKDTRKLLIALGVIVVIIAIFVALFLLRKTPRVLTIDELHQENLKGTLKPEQGYMYNGYSFVKFGELWYSQVKKNSTTYDITFNYDPKSVENITVDGQLTTQFTKGKHIYITFDPEGRDLKYVAVANFGLTRSLAWAFNYNMTAGCTKNVTMACATAGIVTCEDKDKAVIYFKEANETSIILSSSCVTLQGTGPELVRAKDRLLMRWYGITNE